MRYKIPGEAFMCVFIKSDRVNSLSPACKFLSAGFSPRLIKTIKRKRRTMLMDSSPIKRSYSAEALMPLSKRQHPTSASRQSPADSVTVAEPLAEGVYSISDPWVIERFSSIVIRGKISPWTYQFFHYFPSSIVALLIFSSQRTVHNELKATAPIDVLSALSPLSGVINRMLDRDIGGVGPDTRGF